MLKRYSTILGIGLLILWATGMGSPDAVPWMVWLIGMVALGSFGVAAFTPTYTNRNTKMAEAILLATGLFFLWVAGLLNGVVSWLDWWTFAFACAYLLLGVAVGLASEKRSPLAEVPPHERFMRPNRPQGMPPNMHPDMKEEERERFRRGA